MMQWRSKWILAASAIVIALAAAIAWLSRGPGGPVRPTQSGLVVAPANRPALNRQDAPADQPVSLPPEMKAALELGESARLRHPIPAERMGGIVCGEVSPTGSAADYRRFVYNGAGRTGGIDDGTDVFRRFADKICVMQSGM